MTDTPPSPQEIPAPLRPKAARSIRSSFGSGHGRTIVAMMLREMASRYGRTPGGYVWAVVEPLGMILILSVAFSLMLRSPPLGTSFLLFYATGYLPLSLFLRSSGAVANSLGFSRSLLSYPAVTWFDAVAARAILNVLTDLVVSYLLMVGVLIMVDTNGIIDFGPILQSFAFAALLAAGVGTVNCVLFGFFPIWRTIWGILTRPLFLASGVIWLYEDLPQTAASILWWNPLLHIVSLAREGFYSTYDAQFVSVPYAVGPAMVLVAMGLLLLRRYNLWILGRI